MAKVFNELKNRGVESILIVCMDVHKGLYPLHRVFGLAHFDRLHTYLVRLINTFSVKFELFLTMKCKTFYKTLASQKKFTYLDEKGFSI